MYTTEFSCYGLRPLHSRRLTVLIGFSIAALTFFGVNLYIGERLPKALKGTDSYFFGAAVLFVLWALIIYFTRRFRINIYGDEKGMQVELNDPESYDPILLRTPFTISKQWIRRKNGDAYIKELFLTFFDKQNVPVLTLKGTLGDLRDVPPRFSYIDSHSADRKYLKLSDCLYNANVREIEDILYIHLTYLENRNK